MHGLFMRRMAPHAIALAFVSMVLSRVVACPWDATAEVPRLNTPYKQLSTRA